MRPRAIVDHHSPVSRASVEHLAAVAFAGTITYLIRTGPQSHRWRTAFIVTWSVGLLWIFSVFVPIPQGQAGISVMWAALAAGAIVAGLRLASSTIKTTGLVTLGLVVAKLLTVDLAEVDVFWRVGLFFVVGGGLMRLAYALPKLGQPKLGPQHAANEPRC